MSSILSDRFELSGSVTEWVGEESVVTKDSDLTTFLSEYGDIEKLQAQQAKGIEWDAVADVEKNSLRFVVQQMNTSNGTSSSSSFTSDPRWSKEMREDGVKVAFVHVTNMGKAKMGGEEGIDVEQLKQAVVKFPKCRTFIENAPEEANGKGAAHLHVAK